MSVITKRPGSLGNAASIVFFGNLVWLGWLWVTVLVLLPLALLIIGLAGGNLTESLWAQGGVGWQRWMMFAGGVLTPVTFLRLVVTRGMTRRRLAQGSVVAMTLLSAIGAAVAVVGFTVERAFFSANDWPQRIKDLGVLEWGDLPRLAVEHGLLFAVYYLSGWLIGSAFVRSGTVIGIASIVPALVPVAVVELTVSRSAGGFNIGALPDAVQDPAVALSVVVALAVIAATSVLASRVTRELPLR